MPIVTIGESKQVEFGSGDIEVYHGSLKDDDKIGIVLFVENDTANPIGTKTHYAPNMEIDIEETPVRLLFHKTESIDVVIRALEYTKEIMNKTKEEEEK